MTSPLRVVVIGTGSIVERAHLPTLAADHRVALAAICGRDVERTQQLAARFGIASQDADWRTVLDRDDIDAVVVALHNAAHAEVTAAALRSGKHVFCEKPLALDERELDRVGDADAAVDRVLAVNFNLRRIPDLAEIEGAARRGDLGRLRTLRLEMRRRSGIPGFGSWFTRRSQAGGGAVLDLGSHMVDLALWLTGFAEAERLSGETWADHGPRGLGGGDWGRRSEEAIFDVDDRAVLNWRTREGVHVQIDVAWAMHGAEGLRVEVVGDRGGALYAPGPEVGGPSLSWYRESGGVFAEEIAPEGDRGAVLQAWASGARHFVGACLGEPTEIATYAQAAQGLRILFAVRDAVV